MSGSTRTAVAAFALAFAFALGPARDTVSAQAAASGLAEARAALSKAQAAELPGKLHAYLASLPIHDALALVDECLPRLARADKASFQAETAGLALLIGSFADASVRYESASTFSEKGSDPGLLVKAGRCALAAGDADRATQLSALVLAQGADPASLAGARLLGAWTLAYGGRSSDALAIVSAMLGPAAPSSAAAAPPAAAGQAELPAELRREARFLAWLCSANDDKPKAAAALAAEFPGSPEALVVAGSASTPPLPHWYLGGLGALKGRSAVGAPGAAAAAPAKAATAGAAAAPGAAAPGAAAPGAVAPAGAATASGAAAPGAAAAPGGRLQVGYFSVEENAKRLAAELKSKGFTVSIEARPRAAGSAAAAESRWIVLVAAGADPSATMRVLKDAGYESYGVE
jgi:hypothetical protein